jgi:hypothetical protein
MSHFISAAVDVISLSLSLCVPLFYRSTDFTTWTAAEKNERKILNKKINLKSSAPRHESIYLILFSITLPLPLSRSLFESVYNHKNVGFGKRKLMTELRQKLI